MAEECDIFPEEHRSNFSFFRVIGPRHSLAVEPIREWMNDQSRPGLYAFGQKWLASEDNFSPRDCIEIAITDPNVAIEFKLRWV